MDDVEYFFSLMRDVIGQNFIAKEVKFAVCQACRSRFTILLPFIFPYEGCHPEFDKKPDKEKRLPRRASFLHEHSYARSSASNTTNK